jgi:hypothetical protein
MSMVRLYCILRLLCIVIASPVILLCIVTTYLLHPIDGIRHPLQKPLRLLMNVADWVKGLPIGYSYWERYLAPAMLDQIAVHHHEDSGS